MGVREAELARALACCLVRICRGRYTVARQCEEPRHAPLRIFAGDPAVTLAGELQGLRGDVERLRRQIAARREDLPPGAVFSHLTAALIHGLPLVTVPGTAVEAVQEGRSRTRNGWRVRSRAVPAEQTEVAGGYAVTTKVRTLLDVARDHPLLVSVPMLDSAFREEAELEAAVGALVDAEVPRRFRGTVRAALALADGVRESPAESVCAVRFLEHGIMGFEPQVRICDEAGREVGRVDFAHREAMIAVEVDGEEKYGLDGQDPQERFRAEREREYALRNLGYRPFRLRWEDLFRAKVFLQIRHALVLGTVPGAPGRG